jgi:hypothetical protein
MHCRKAGMIPTKANPDIQAQYEKEELAPRLAQAKEEKRAVFMDAAHFVLAPFLGFLWDAHWLNKSHRVSVPSNGPNPQPNELCPYIIPSLISVP